MLNKINIQLIILFTSVISFCFFMTLSNSVFSNDIDEALIIAGMINVPDTNSPQLEIFSNSKSLLNYFISVLLKVGFSVYATSNIILFISTLFFFIGIYLVLKNLISLISKRYTKLISFFSTCWFIISDTNLPHTDYPNAFFGSFSAGLYSIAITTLIFGLIIEGKKKLIIFFSITLFLFHPVQGLWIISLLILMMIIDKIFILKKFDKTDFKKIILLISPLFLIVILFIFNSVIDDESIVDIDLVKIWLKNWEYHRNNLEIRYSYLKPTILLLFLSILCFMIFKKHKETNLYRFYLFLILTILLSTLIYIGYKIFYNYLPLFIISPMPTRVINTHAIIAYPMIIISSIYLVNHFSKFIKINSKYILIIFCFSLLAFYIFNHNSSSLNARLDRIYKMRFESNFLNFVHNLKSRDYNFYDVNFWNKVKSLDDNSYTIVTFSTENLTYRYANLPYIIKISSFDYVLYYPWTAKQTFSILEKIYGVDINKDKELLSENNIKINFEKKINEEWKQIKQNFNTKYVIVPSNWNLDLKEILSNDEFKVYEI